MTDTYSVVLNRDSFHKRDEIMAWCEEHFGPRLTHDYGYSERWQLQDGFGNQFYKFTNPEDAAFFTLKWK